MGARAAAADDRPQSREHLRVGEGLGQIVVGAAIEPGDPIPHGGCGESGVWSPILMLTAATPCGIGRRARSRRRRLSDQALLLREMLARLRAIVRRGRPERPSELEVGDLRLDPATRQAWRGSTEVALSAKEFALLETFMRRPGEVLSRFQLIEHAWDYGVREPLPTSSTPTCGSCAARSTARSGSSRSRPCAGWGTDCGRTADVEPGADRLRVTIAFTVAMAVVLVAAGFFVYFRLEARLDESINNGLRSRAGEVSALARTSQRTLGGARRGSLIEATRASPRS